ncbi:MAG TPA: hypothetical protein VMU01_12615 [Rhizomicrobium sp.]|nr:hypothetical protein [Rhizomicrobium sp.]
MRFTLSILAAGMLAATAAQARNDIPMDKPVDVSGIETVCTGIGSAQDDPRWKTYPVRIDFSNKKHEYVSDADVVLSKADGTALAQFFCPATWVLFKLPAGDYQVKATVAPGPGGTATMKFTAPAKGQKRVILVFTSPLAE